MGVGMRMYIELAIRQNKVSSVVEFVSRLDGNKAS